MTNEEFMPKNLREGDWLCIAYHRDIKVCVLNVLDNKVVVSGMPSPLFFQEYWPLELTQETIDVAEISDVIKQMEEDGVEHLYVHQVQHYMTDKNIDKERARRMIRWAVWKMRD